MHKLVSFFKSKPLFLFLLPAFFVFHGFTENYHAIPFKDALWLLFGYLVAALILFFVSWLFLRQAIKSSVFSFCIMGFDFSFGNIKDSLKALFADALITRYIFLVPFFLLVFVFIAWWLKKEKRSMYRLGFYLNTLLVILILADAFSLLQKKEQRRYAVNSSSELSFKCDSCVKPDIYFLVFDEYSSSTALKEKWGYNNNDLDTFLLQKGFKLIPYSKSNYNFTEFSMASILNMDYLKIADPSACTIKDYNNCFESIRENQVCHILRSMDYDIVNCSIFDLQKKSSLVNEGFLPLKTKLITAQTFTGRVKRDLLFHILSGKTKIRSLSKYFFYATYRNNQKLIKATIQTAVDSSTKPRFVYSHIEMPHHPFYFNKYGQEKSTTELPNENITSYLDYLPSTNQVVKQMVRSILDHSKKPVVIVLMGDHGFREQQERDFQFKNLNAVYISSGHYSGFSDSITSVNEYRILFNNLFHASFPLKKDSTVFLLDKIGD